MEISPPTMEPGNSASSTSLLARMFNVFATPAEVFDEVKKSRPSTANWLVPMLLTILMGSIAVIVLYSQPVFLQKIHDQQAKAFEKQVQSGKMTQAQADQAEAMVAKFSGSGFLMFTGVFGVVAVMVARLFWWALVVWLLGKWFLKANFSYQQSMEVAGLASMISVLGSIVTTLLTACFGDLTPLSLALLDRQGEPSSLLHISLGTVDVFDLWSAGVLAVALARLAGVAWSKALKVILIYWFILDAVIVSFGWLAVKASTGFK